jgi:hypothetical protein
MSLNHEGDDMSVDATRWAWQQQMLSSTQKLVLLSLADRAGEEHTCWPSIRRLMRDTCIANKHTVINALKDLESLDLIASQKEVGKTATYTLLGVHDRWLTDDDNDTSAKTGTSAKTDTSAKTGTQPVPKMTPPPVPKMAPEPISEPINEPISEPNNSRARGSPPKKPGVERVYPVGVSPKVWSDWLAIRHAKSGGPVTQTTLDAITAEATRAGISLETALRECCARGWASFKAKWLDTEQATIQPHAPTQGKHLAVMKAILGFGLQSTPLNGQQGMEEVTPLVHDYPPEGEVSNRSQF